MNRSPAADLVRFNMAAHRHVQPKKDGPPAPLISRRMVSTASYPFVELKKKARTR